MFMWNSIWKLGAFFLEPLWNHDVVLVGVFAMGATRMDCGGRQPWRTSDPPGSSERRTIRCIEENRRVVRNIVCPRCFTINPTQPEEAGCPEIVRQAHRHPSIKNKKIQESKKLKVRSCKSVAEPSEIFAECAN